MKKLALIIGLIVAVSVVGGFLSLSGKSVPDLPPDSALAPEAALALGSAAESGPASATAAAVEALPAAVADVRQAALPPPPFAYAVEPNYVVFSWALVAGMRRYQLFFSTDEIGDGDVGAEAGFSPVAGAQNIEAGFFRLRIRPWLVDWLQTRYQLRACPASGAECTVVGTVGLTRKDARRAVDEIWLPEIQPASDVDTRVSLALSDDGNTMAWSGRIRYRKYHKPSHLSHPIGGFFSDVLHISRRVDGRWQAEAVLRIADRFNTQVSKAIALSADGNTLAFGSTDHFIHPREADWPNTHYIRGQGAVYIYVRRHGRWSKQSTLTSGITGPPFGYGTAYWTEFGSSLALSADGRTLAVGDPHRSQLAKHNDSDPTGNEDEILRHGAVYIFSLTKSGWRKRAYLTAANKDEHDRFGHSVSLSADGRTLAVGMPYEDGRCCAPDQKPDSASNSLTNSGAVYIYTQQRKAWRQQAYLKGSDLTAGALFGTAVSLDASGTVLAAGAPRQSDVTPHFGFTRHGPIFPRKMSDIQSPGATHLYARQGGIWEEFTKLAVGEAGVRDGFGSALALSADGKTLVVGAPTEDVAVLPGGTSELPGSTSSLPGSIVGLPGVTAGLLGVTDGLLGVTDGLPGVTDGLPGVTDGLLGVTAAYAQCRAAGAAYIYSLSGQTVAGPRRLTAPYTHLWNLFGAFVAISASADTLSIAAPGWRRTHFLTMFDGLRQIHEKVAQYQRPDLQRIYVY